MTPEQPVYSWVVIWHDASDKLWWQIIRGTTIDDALFRTDNDKLPAEDTEIILIPIYSLSSSDLPNTGILTRRAAPMTFKSKPRRSY